MPVYPWCAPRQVVIRSEGPGNLIVGEAGDLIQWVSPIGVVNRDWIATGVAVKSPIPHVPQRVAREEPPEHRAVGAHTHLIVTRQVGPTPLPAKGLGHGQTCRQRLCLIALHRAVTVEAPGVPVYLSARNRSDSVTEVIV